MSGNKKNKAKDISAGAVATRRIEATEGKGKIPKTMMFPLAGMRTSLDRGGKKSKIIQAIRAEEYIREVDRGGDVGRMNKIGR